MHHKSSEEIREEAELAIRELDRDVLVRHMLYEYMMLTAYYNEIEPMTKSFLFILRKPNDSSSLIMHLFPKFGTIVADIIRGIAVTDELAKLMPDKYDQEKIAAIHTAVDNFTAEVRSLNAILKPLQGNQHTFKSLKAVSCFFADGAGYLKTALSAVTDIAIAFSKECPDISDQKAKELAMQSLKTTSFDILDTTIQVGKKLYTICESEERLQ